jgi:type IV secretory pathway TrbL component
MDAWIFLLYLVLWLSTILRFFALFFQLYLWEALLACLLLIGFIIVGINLLQSILINIQPLSCQPLARGSGREKLRDGGHGPV